MYVIILMCSSSNNLWRRRTIPVGSLAILGMAMGNHQVTSCGSWIWTLRPTSQLPTAGGRWILAAMLVPMAVSITWPYWIWKGECGFTTVTSAAMLRSFGSRFEESNLATGNLQCGSCGNMQDDHPIRGWWSIASDSQKVTRCSFLSFVWSDREDYLQLIQKKVG